MTTISNSPKTGRSMAMRMWMFERNRVFTARALCEAMHVKPGPERDKIRSTLGDFIARGEITRVGRGKYRYNHGWQKVTRCPMRQKIYKAMYVLAQTKQPVFTTKDIRRYAETDYRDSRYVERTINKLIASGHVQVQGHRSCECGKERLFKITSMERFRVEVLR